MRRSAPVIQEAYKICLDYFRDDPNGVLAAQDILRKGPHLSNILDTMSISERAVVSKFMQDFPQATSRDIWNQLEKLAAERSSGAASYKEKQTAKVMLKEIVLHFTYPRLDINVSKQMNHLLKSPFVVHPKTGRVCVPIDPEKLDQFNPLEVPTVGRLVEELNRNEGDARETSLKAYTHFFEVGFLQELERDAIQKMQLEGDLTF